MQFVDTLRKLPLSRQIILAGSVLGVVLAMVLIVQSTTSTPLALLYSGLEDERAGEILSELEQSGVKYELRGDAIFVPGDVRDRIRLSLAEQGLPRQSIKGYELLDSVNGFSVTSEMYKASYWRAKEGELTRTILSMQGVQGARVHIGANLRSGFTRSQTPPTASVTLSLARAISKDQAEGIQYMVALAVPGLAPADVAIIDVERGILVGPNTAPGQLSVGFANEKEQALEAKLLAMIEARLGIGNARVSVSAEVNRDVERVSSLQIDPESRVIRQRTVSDVAETSTRSGGSITVASNLPDGGGAAGGGTSDARNSSESVAYEFNQVRSERERLPGEITRLSVGILLNEQVIELPEGADLAAFQTEIISEFEQLVSAAAGLNMARGDSLTIELMPFVAPPEEPLVEPPGLAERVLERHLWSGVQFLMLAIVVLALAFGVIRPALSTKPRALEKKEADDDAEGAEQTREIDPVRYLQTYASKRQAETEALLKEWLAEDQRVVVND